jgi:hypothetical protein
VSKGAKACPTVRSTVTAYLSWTIEIGRDWYRCQIGRRLRGKSENAINLVQLGFCTNLVQFRFSSAKKARRADGPRVSEGVRGCLRFFKRVQGCPQVSKGFEGFPGVSGNIQGIPGCHTCSTATMERTRAGLRLVTPSGMLSRYV